MSEGGMLEMCVTAGASRCDGVEAVEAAVS